MSQEDLKIGSLIDSEQHRDAIHVAVAPMVAAERLSPGQHIGIKDEGAGVVASPIGIVDPFLKGAVFAGDRFWMFLYPGSITSLRHEWTHPALAANDSAIVENASVAWIRQFAEGHGMTYQRFIDAAEDYIRDGEYLCDGGRFEGEYVPKEFWDHYEKATGKEVKSDDRGSFFTCSC